MKNKALIEHIASNYNKYYNYAMKLAKNKSVAEDILHDSIQYLMCYEGEIVSYSSYIYRTLQGRLSNRKRDAFSYRTSGFQYDENLDIRTVDSEKYVNDKAFDECLSIMQHQCTEKQNYAISYVLKTGTALGSKYQFESLKTNRNFGIRKIKRFCQERGIEDVTDLYYYSVCKNKSKGV